MQAKEKILIAAERLFAERGFGVSLREIAVAAGQRNHSAVQYHFGDKTGLVDALYAYRMTPLDHRRRALVEDIHARNLAQDLPALVEGIVAPLAEHVVAHRGASWYLRFTSRYVLSAGYLDQPYSAAHHPAVDELVALLFKRLPTLREERLRVFNLHMVAVLADLEQRLDDPAFPLPEATAALTDLRTTCLSVLTATTP